MARTDKTRPHWVKMADDPGNYREVHNHATRLLRDEHGEYVRVPTGEISKFTGQPITRIVRVPFDECDLPDSPTERQTNYDGCHYDYTYSWINSGQARCGCNLCQDTLWRREENRRQRRAARQETRDVARQIRRSASADEVEDF
jgi:hypothetical protein